MLRLLTRLVGSRNSADQASPALLRDALRRKDFARARAVLARLQRDSEPATAKALEGELLYHEQRDEAAEQAFRAALTIDPGLADAHYGLSLLASDLTVAAGHAQFAVNRAPSEARYLAQLGYLHLCLGNPQAAEQALSAATKLDADDPHAWNNLGIVMRAKGDQGSAKACFLAALKAQPGHPRARENLDQLGRDPGLAPASAIPAAANVDIDALEARCADDPHDPSLTEQLAQAYRRQGDFDSAANVLEQALERQPHASRLRGELGIVLAKRRQIRAAIEHLEAAIATCPDEVDYLLHLAVCHNELAEHTKAMPLIDRAHTLAPDNLEVQAKRLACLTNLCRYDDALALARHLEDQGIQTDCTGLIHIFLGQNEAAEAWLTKRLGVLPHDPGLRFQRAQLRLSQLDFEHGWDDYAYRGLGDARSLRVLPFALWQGEPLAGKRIIVLAEQGLGDQVMFASCLPDLLAFEPTEVIVEAIDRIAPTLQRSFPQCRVIPTRQNKTLDWVKDCGAVDCYVPLADLPRYFRRRLEAFPQQAGYLLADPQRQAFWDSQLPPRTANRPRIGLSWRGGTEGTRSFVRSIDPAWLGALADCVQADWISLQYGNVVEELPRARSHGMPSLFHAPDAIQNLDEFAAVVSTLDLVITVCNTTVHYAGALGVPVWVLSPHVPEWRYGLHNDILPWYPTSRMFRQTASSNWQETITRVGEALHAKFARQTFSA